MKNTVSPLKFMPYLVLLLTLFSFPAHASVPDNINYQGYLTDSNNNPINGTTNITFSLYSVKTGGVPLWADAVPVTISNGLFTVMLGGTIPFPATLFDTPLWLGINVEGDGEMTPRTELNSSAYAFHAKTADQVSCINGDSMTCYTGPANTRQVGSCRTGTRTCIDGVYSACQGEILPAATEVCDNRDENCDGLVDNDATDFITWHADTDSDLFGNLASTNISCSAPEGYVADSTDCDDTRNDTYPGALEFCDAIDNNCNGQIDESCTTCTNEEVNVIVTCSASATTIANMLFCANNTGNGLNPTCSDSLTTLVNCGIAAGCTLDLTGDVACYQQYCSTQYSKIFGP